jgi:hypothetical protein
MRITILFAILMTLLPYCHAQEDLVDEVTYYKGHGHSIIDWPDLEERDYLSWDLWLDERLKKDKNPNDAKDKRDLQLKERMGFVLACVGSCDIYRGLKHSQARHLSSLREGDDIETGKDSYLWVFLLDGTLVRLAPESSVSLNEFNLSPSSLFYYVRVNIGNVLWWNRHGVNFKPHNRRETDTLFLPSPLLEANFQEKEIKVTKDNFLQKSKKDLRKYYRLNSFIKKNENIVNKKTFSFIVLPNATVMGSDFVADFVVLKYGKSYIKRRSSKTLNYMTQEDSSYLNAFYRGFKNRGSLRLMTDFWYEVNEDGKKIEKVEDDHFLSIGMFPTKSVPTILTTRELMFSKYSSFLYSKISRKSLSRKHGYRLWTDEEVKQRTSFLTEYTRRVETTNLNVVAKKRESLEDNGIKVDVGQYSYRFFEKAMSSYLGYKDYQPSIKEKQSQLNSEKKKFWKVIHGQY